MGLEDYIPDESGEGSSASAEIAEKIKDGIKKGTSGTKRVKKDEKKARIYDLSLANFLVKILLEKKYDSLTDIVFGTIHSGAPSNLVLGMLSLIHPEISNYIREKTGKKIIEFHFKSEETIKFSDSHLPEELKLRINQWIEDIVDILEFDPSALLIDKAISTIDKNEKIYVLGAKILIYFMGESNVYINKSKSSDYINYILKNVIHKKITNNSFKNKLDNI